MGAGKIIAYIVAGILVIFGILFILGSGGQGGGGWGWVLSADSSPRCFRTDLFRLDAAKAGGRNPECHSEHRSSREHDHGVAQV